MADARSDVAGPHLTAFDGLVLQVHPAPPVGDAPVVQIHAPADGAKVTGPVAILGFAAQPKLFEARGVGRRQQVLPRQSSAGAPAAERRLESAIRLVGLPILRRRQERLMRKTHR